MRIELSNRDKLFLADSIHSARRSSSRDFQWSWRRWEFLICRTKRKIKELCSFFQMKKIFYRSYSRIKRKDIRLFALATEHRRWCSEVMLTSRNNKCRALSRFHCELSRAKPKDPNRSRDVDTWGNRHNSSWKIEETNGSLKRQFSEDRTNESKSKWDTSTR